MLRQYVQNFKLISYFTNIYMFILYYMGCYKYFIGPKVSTCNAYMKNI